MNHLKSLRQYVDALEQIGELQKINKQVDLNLEIGAICRRAYETGAPAPLFKNISGMQKGSRVLGAPRHAPHRSDFARFGGGRTGRRKSYGVGRAERGGNRVRIKRSWIAGCDGVESVRVGESLVRDCIGKRLAQTHRLERRRYLPCDRRRFVSDQGGNGNAEVSDLQRRH